MKKALTTITLLAIALPACGGLDEGGDIDSQSVTSASLLSPRAQLREALDELNLTVRDMTKSGERIGTSNCASKRKGFGKETISDFLECFTPERKQELRDALDCNEIPLFTGPRALLWFRNCGLKPPMELFYWGIDCSTVDIIHKQQYKGFKNHFRARKCGLGPLACEIDGAVIPNNQHFLAYSTSSVQSWSGSAYPGGWRRSCSDVVHDFVCREGNVEPVGDHSFSANFLTCTLECWHREDGDNNQVACSGSRVAEEIGHMDEMREAAAQEAAGQGNEFSFSGGKVSVSTKDVHVGGGTIGADELPPVINPDNWDRILREPETGVIYGVPPGTESYEILTEDGYIVDAYDQEDLVPLNLWH